jgi:hypothetical protein
VFHGTRDKSKKQESDSSRRIAFLFWWAASLSEASDFRRTRFAANSSAGAQIQVAPRA